MNPRDAVDDKLALADRCGLSIIDGYTQAFGLTFEQADALEWAKRRGARSGRTAWQYVTELAGRARKAI